MMATHKLKPVIYIAGRYSDGGTLNDEERWKNRNIMRYYSIKFMKRGWAVLCPIENDEWAYEDGVITYEDTLSSDLAVIHKCDAIFFCPGWEKGRGTLIEHKFAQDYEIPIWYEVVNADEDDKRPPARLFVNHSGPEIPSLTTDEINEQVVSEDLYVGDLSLDDYRKIIQKHPKGSFWQKEKTDGETG